MAMLLRKLAIPAATFLRSGKTEGPTARSSAHSELCLRTWTWPESPKLGELVRVQTHNKGKTAIEARPHTTIEGAFWGRRTPQPNPRVNAYELKINPNNESIFLTHPNGGLVQFENLVGTTVVQDGKLVMSAKSAYHVADMPPFAAKAALAEARRQVEAASKVGLNVEWLVSDARAEQPHDALPAKQYLDNGAPLSGVAVQ